MPENRVLRMSKSKNVITKSKHIKAKSKPGIQQMLHGAKCEHKSEQHPNWVRLTFVRCCCCWLSKLQQFYNCNYLANFRSPSHFEFSFAFCDFCDFRLSDWHQAKKYQIMPKKLLNAFDLNRFATCWIMYITARSWNMSWHIFACWYYEQRQCTFSLQLSANQKRKNFKISCYT